MSSIIRLSLLAAVSAMLASCQNGGQSSSSSSNDPYVANFGNDGAYHPYPGQSGTMQSGSHAPAPTYTPPPTPPAQSDPYAFSGPSTASSKPASSSSHSSTKTKPKSAATKATASTASADAPKPHASTGSSSKPKSTAKSGTKKKSSGGSYKVVQGDTLYGIARKKGSTVAKIKAANNLSSDLIRPGQALKIP